MQLVHMETTMSGNESRYKDFNRSWTEAKPVTSFCSVSASTALKGKFKCTLGPHCTTCNIQSQRFKYHQLKKSLSKLQYAFYTSTELYPLQLNSRYIITKIHSFHYRLVAHWITAGNIQCCNSCSFTGHSAGQHGSTSELKFQTSSGQVLFSQYFISAARKQ